MDHIHDLDWFLNLTSLGCTVKEGTWFGRGFVSPCLLCDGKARMSHVGGHVVRIAGHVVGVAHVVVTCENAWLEASLLEAWDLMGSRMSTGCLGSW